MTAPRRPFEELLHQVQAQVARVTGCMRPIVFEYDPAETEPSLRWEVWIITGRRSLGRDDSPGDVFHGETGESALRRCLEAYARRPAGPSLK